VSLVLSVLERLVRRIKREPAYRIEAGYSVRQLLTASWHRAWQLVRGLSVQLLSGGVQAPVFRGRRVVIEHAYQLWAGPGLILEDGVTINALSRDGIRLGRNVTIARGAVVTCTGVLARLGSGVRVGDRSAIGASAFIAGQGGIEIGCDVLLGPGVRIFSEDHRYESVDAPIRMQGESRLGVKIEDDCWIGAGVTIVDGVVVGRGCVIAAGAVVTRSLPAFSVAAGVPARVIKSRQRAPLEAAHDCGPAIPRLYERLPVDAGPPVSP
jgi:serine acetyltransferase